MDQLKTKEINPILLLPVVIVVLLVLAFFLFIKPGMDASAALKNFNSPEAQARRDPDQRKPHSASAEKLRQEILAKERHMGRVSRRDAENNAAR
ncbi:MAG: hypothetical protein SFU56_21490 [Capsulimonadales bacterium]|nr:hypothetical protein [Capsulimonadales bacterium]